MLTLDEARADGIWLLDLEIGGAVFRFATEPVEVTSGSGETFRYDEGLSEPALSLVADGAVEQSVSLVTESQEDWALIESRGHSIERSRGVLRRWHEGQVLERARVYLSGLALDIGYGEAGEPLGLSLTRSPALESGDLLDPQAEVRDSPVATWPLGGSDIISDRLLGASYPLVIGCPGHDPSQPYPRPGSPALLVEYDTVTAADSRVLISVGPIAATTVQVHNITQAGVGTRTPDPGDIDGLGRRCSTSQFTALAANVPVDEKDELWVGFSPEWGGGVPNPFRPGTLRGGGDVIEWALLFHSTVRVDRGRMGAVRDWLNRFSVDTYVNSNTNTWDWVSSLLRWIPVVPRESSEGLWFLPIRWDQTKTDVTTWLSVDRGEIERVSEVRKLDQPVANEITVRFRPVQAGTSGKKWYSSVTLTAKDGTLSGTTEDTEDPRIIGSYLAARSQQVFGVRPLTVDIPQTWDDGTALLVAQLLLERYAWPKRQISYQGGPELEAIEPGSVVAITDSGLYLDEAVALVMDVRLQGGGMVVLDLVLLDHPVRGR